MVHIHLVVSSNKQNGLVMDVHNMVHNAVHNLGVSDVLHLGGVSMLRV